LTDACEVALLDERGAVRRLVFASGVNEDRLRRRELTPLGINDRHPISDVLRTGASVLLDASGEVESYAFGPPDVNTTSPASASSTRRSFR
jgi:hypothetical protein